MLVLIVSIHTKQRLTYRTLVKMQDFRRTVEDAVTKINKYATNTNQFACELMLQGGRDSDFETICVSKINVHC